ncbi:2-aminobenzoate-CoA ligase [Ornithinicoccus hortensis]|uniref:2-aminobenzoate-CoA ligase n=2 Tax=Ornithinicoccus hortensis TaxID=82346 RepID=A0A542YU56_9MICO|nr:2-aminobenzoate-CoA ligase [Ornithinicoccus hortensis]
MQLSRSAHVDTFCRDNLPPQDQWPEFRFDIPGVQYPERLNCAVELLDKVIEEHGGDRTCLLTPAGERWTYQELLDSANRIANHLVDDLGIVPGNRVMLRGPNNPWLVACWFAVLRAGAVVIPTMPLLRPRELQVMGEIGRFDLALCDHRFVADLEAAGIPELRIVEYAGEGAADLAARVADKSATFEPVDTAADDVCTLAFTSGTTGKPKATMHFHRDILANADTFSAEVLKPVADDVFTGTPPLAFTFGLGGLVVFPMRVGASSLLIEKTTPADLADLIQEHGVTVCFTAPTAYRAMLAAGKAPQLRGLRRAVSAGEHLPASTWEAFREQTGLAIIDGIGSTEMLHIFISAADGDIRPGATGRPVPGYQAMILDAMGQPAPDGTPGRLAVKGPTGCRYLADERQAVYVQDGWNVTGDTFVRDEDGYFWYQARSDDMIVSSGYNIAAPEVEEALMAHPSVLEVAVVGMPDPDRGAVVSAHVVLTEEAAAAAAQDADAVRKELQDHAKAQIAPYKYPRRVEFVEALPRTSTGKVQRYRLREPDGPRR